MLPVKHLKETPSWMAFLHPKPSYPLHVVIVPKRKIRDWMSLPAEAPVFYAEFITLSQELVHDLKLEESGYRFIANGGAYQTFPHFHVHLVSGNAL